MKQNENVDLLILLISFIEFTIRNSMRIHPILLAIAGDINTFSRNCSLSIDKLKFTSKFIFILMKLNVNLFYILNLQPSAGKNRSAIKTPRTNSKNR